MDSLKATKINLFSFKTPSMKAFHLTWISSLANTIRCVSSTESVKSGIGVERMVESLE